MIGEKVLIVVDPSSGADVLFREAFDLCAKLGVQPVVLSTLPHSFQNEVASESSLASEQLSQDIEQQLQDLAIATDQLEVLTPVGDPAIEIRNAAIALDTDLIIMGNHPEVGLGLFLGSTANVVLHDTPCHVLTVRLT